MSANTKNAIRAIGVAVVGALLAAIVVRMVFKKKTDANGQTTTKFLGLVGLDGALAFDDKE